MVKPVKLVIALVSAELPRFADTYECVSSLQKPEDTYICYQRGCSPAENRNMVIKKALETKATHLLFIDDDMVFRPDCLTRLLQHNLPIVSGFYKQRGLPFRPLLMDEFQDDMQARWFFPADSDKGLIEVVATGAGFLLINTEIFEHLEAPYFTLGQIDQVGWSDDIHFFWKVNKTGIKVYVDLDCPIGHKVVCTIWPDKTEGKWSTTLDCHGPIKLTYDGKG